MESCAATPRRRRLSSPQHRRGQRSPYVARLPQTPGNCGFVAQRSPEQSLQDLQALSEDSRYGRGTTERRSRGQATVRVDQSSEEENEGRRVTSSPSPKPSLF